MKIAFSTSGETLDAPLDSRFGRAPRFLIHDVDSGVSELVENQQNLNAPQGAGIQSAQTVARCGVESVVTGHCGPKAFRVLKAAGIRVYTSDAATVNQALEQLLAGELEEAQEADVEGHWS